MNSRSEKTLQRVAENDDVYDTLRIGYGWYGDNVPGIFDSIITGDFARLGKAIAINTNLTRLDVELLGGLNITSDTGFYEGLKQNSSIDTLELSGMFEDESQAVWSTDFTETGRNILMAYQENYTHITFLRIEHCNILQDGSDSIIATTYKRCINLKHISIVDCNITIEWLLLIVEAVKGHPSLEKLWMDRGIENSGCSVISSLLEDQSSSLRDLWLIGNEIGNEGATKLVNGLANNSMLEELVMGGNPNGQTIVDLISELVCNTSSINGTFTSNHTLAKFSPGEQTLGIEKQPRLRSFLSMNKTANKSHVAIKKILKYHPYINMEPLFGWDKDGERSLKSLPYVIEWFDRASVAVVDYEKGSSRSSLPSSDSFDFNEEERYDYHLEERKLSSVYEFALVMPLLFVPSSHTNVDDKKRKSTAH